MQISADSIVENLMKDIAPSKIETPSPEDPVAFADHMEKLAAGEIEEEAPVSRSMEEYAKVAVAQEIL